MSLTAEKKNCLLFIRSEINCTFMLGVEKKFDRKGNTIAPHVSNGPPLMGMCYLLNEKTLALGTHRVISAGWAKAIIVVFAPHVTNVFA